MYFNLQSEKTCALFLLHISVIPKVVLIHGFKLTYINCSLMFYKTLV